MSDASSDAVRSFQHTPVRTSIEVDAVANAASAALDLRDDELAFEWPGPLFEQLPRRAGSPT
jgi:hypothetical protein